MRLIPAIRCWWPSFKINLKALVYSEIKNRISAGNVLLSGSEMFMASGHCRGNPQITVGSEPRH
jgi:hypothetical protein